MDGRRWSRDRRQRARRWLHPRRGSGRPDADRRREAPALRCGASDLGRRLPEGVAQRCERVRGIDDLQLRRVRSEVARYRDVQRRDVERALARMCVELGSLPGHRPARRLGVRTARGDVLRMGRAVHRRLPWELRGRQMADETRRLRRSRALPVDDPGARLDVPDDRARHGLRMHVPQCVRGSSLCVLCRREVGSRGRLRESGMHSRSRLPVDVARAHLRVQRPYDVRVP